MSEFNVASELFNGEEKHPKDMSKEELLGKLGISPKLGEMIGDGFKNLTNVMVLKVGATARGMELSETPLTSDWSDITAKEFCHMITGMGNPQGVLLFTIGMKIDGPDFVAKFLNTKHEEIIKRRKENQ